MIRRFVPIIKTIEGYFVFSGKSWQFLCQIFTYMNVKI